MGSLLRKVLISLLLQVVFGNFISVNSAENDFKQLSLQNCSAFDLKHINDTNNIAKLLLNACDFKNLENNSFTTYTSLRELQITHGQLNTLGKCTLNGLKRLRYLSLASNNLSSLQSWSQEPLNGLSVLNLQSNKIKVIEADSFEYCTNLQSLYLGDNLIEILNANGFEKLPFLKYLDLSKNRLAYLNFSTFDGLGQLSVLKLSHNQLQNIADRVFASTMNLKTLDLGHNSMKNLQFLKTKSLQRLMFLNLSHNEISELKANSFESNSDISTLDLSWNLLTKLENDSLKGLRSLEYLNISNNKLATVGEQCFKERNALKEIDLSFNTLRSISVNLFKAASLLERINLAQNKLTAISEKLFAHLPFLSNVNVSGNKLTNVKFTAHFATALQHSELILDFGDNLLQDSTLNMTQLNVFRRVNLAGNHFSCVWVIRNIAIFPSSLVFGRDYEFSANAWGNNTPNLTSFDCHEDHQKRSIIVLQSPCTLHPTAQSIEWIPKLNNCTEQQLHENPSPPPLVWPKIRVDKFDSRSVIIWMLIAIAVAFAGLRVARHLIEERDERKLFGKLKHQDSDCTELEVLRNEVDDRQKSNAFDR